LNLFKSRFERAKKLMQERGIDALWLIPSANMYYLTGFWPASQGGNISSFLLKSGDAIFIVPEMYYEQVSKQSWIKDIRIWKGMEDFDNILKDSIKELNLSSSNVALEDRTWAEFIMRIKKNFGRIRLSLASEILKDLRIRKSEEEIILMKKAGKIASEIMNVVTSKIDVGMTELEISGLIEYEARKMGSEKMSFETITSFSNHSSKPHNEPGVKKLRKKDIIMIDFGPRFKKYCSDITRTFFIGEPTGEVIKVYKATEKAQKKALSSVKSNMKASNIDKVARDVFKENGYEGYFIHGTGHGVGLDIHEEPYIAKESKSIIEKGMTFTIEPGIYLRNRFGIRIEDTLLVTDDGSEVLTSFPKDLLII
jgi:Xaa-Pro dipeptidase